MALKSVNVNINSAPGLGYTITHPSAWASMFGHASSTNLNHGPDDKGYNVFTGNCSLTVGRALSKATGNPFYRVAGMTPFTLSLMTRITGDKLSTYTNPTTGASTTTYSIPLTAELKKIYDQSVAAYNLKTEHDKLSGAKMYLEAANPFNVVGMQDGGNVPQYLKGSFKGGVYYVNYPNHKVHIAGKAKAGLGHGAVLIVNPNGVTKYYDYGRYPGSGNVGVTTTDTNIALNAINTKDGNGIWRNVAVPNAVFAKNGELDHTAMALALREKFGDDVELTFVADADPTKTEQFILNDANDRNREAYGLTTGLNCGTQAELAINAGRSGWSKIRGVVRSMVARPFKSADAIRSLVAPDSSPLWTTGVVGLTPSGRAETLDAQGYPVTAAASSTGAVQYKKGGNIHIKKSHEGKFTEYCGGKVTDECIQRAKHSTSAAVRKRATFAANARTWKHLTGGKVFFNTVDNSTKGIGLNDIAERYVEPSDNSSTNTESTTDTTGKDWTSKYIDGAHAPYATTNPTVSTLSTSVDMNNPLLQAVLSDTDHMDSADLGNNYTLTHESHKKCTSGPKTWYARAGIDLQFWDNPWSTSTTSAKFTLDPNWELVFSGNGPDADSFQAQPGDVSILFANYENGLPTSHAAMYTGSDWRSDFIQRKCWVYGDNAGRNGDQSVLIWRYKPFHLEATQSAKNGGRLMQTGGKAFFNAKAAKAYAPVIDGPAAKYDNSIDSATSSSDTKSTIPGGTWADKYLIDNAQPETSTESTALSAITDTSSSTTNTGAHTGSYTAFRDEMYAKLSLLGYGGETGKTLVAQLGSESRHGLLPSGNYNYSNITAGRSWTGKTAKVGSNPLTFRSYDSLDQSMSDYVRLILAYDIKPGDSKDTVISKLNGNNSGDRKWAGNDTDKYKSLIDRVYNMYWS